MSNNSLKNDAALSNSIKNRRLELGMTIEEAARRANVGTKTWSRYESGEAIRSDKVKDVLKSLRWNKFPESKNDDDSNYDLEEYKSHNAWLEFIAENYGQFAAISFCIGTDLLYDDIKMDLNELASMPRNTHIGELNISTLIYYLPELYLMEYNYEFLLKLRISLKSIIKRAVNDNDFKAHNAAEEILLKIVLEEARIYIEEIESDINPNDYAESEAWEYWVYDILEDDDVSLFLYSDLFISPPDNYKFDNWFKGIFLMEKWLVRSFKS